MKSLYKFLLYLLISDNTILDSNMRPIYKGNIEVDVSNGDIFFYYYKTDCTSNIECNIRLRKMYVMKDFKLCNDVTIRNPQGEIKVIELDNYIFDLPTTLQDIDVLFRVFILSHNHCLKLRKPNTMRLCKENNLKYRGYDCKKVKSTVALNRLDRVNEYLTTLYLQLDELKMNSYIQNFIFKYSLMFLKTNNLLDVLNWDKEINTKQKYFKYKRGNLFLIVEKGVDELYE